MKKAQAEKRASPISSQLTTTPANPLLVCSLCGNVLWFPVTCNGCLETFCERCI